MKVTKDLIKHVAKLSKLDFSEQELGPITEKFTEIMTMVEQLNEVDTTDLPVMNWATKETDIMRKDDPVPGMDRETLLKNTKTSYEGYIEVPTVIDENGENEL